MSHTLEVIRSNKGHHKVIHLGFMYTKHKAMGDKIRWRCVQRANQCKGSIFTSSEFTDPRVTVNHNHMPDLDAVEFARSRTIFAERMAWIPSLDFGESIESELENSYIKVELDEALLQSNDRQSSFLSTVSPRTLKTRAVPHQSSSAVPKPTPPSAKPTPMQGHIGAGRPSHVVPRNSTMKPLAPKPVPQQPPPPPPEVCLRWNSYHSNMQATFPSLLNNQQFVDVTLACEGRSLKCHKVMLSACSSYFNDLLSQNPCQHPIILMRDLKFWEVQSLVEFMYRGEVNVSQDKLPSLLSAAEALQIKGLASSPSPPACEDEVMSNSLPMMSDHEFVEKETPSPSSTRRIRRRRTVQPTQPLVLPNPRAARFQRASSSSSAARFQPESEAEEPLVRRRRLDTSPSKQPNTFMPVKLEPPEHDDHSNDSTDLPDNSYEVHRSRASTAECKPTVKGEADSGRNGKINHADNTDDGQTHEQKTDEAGSSEDEGHDIGFSDQHKEDEAGSPYDQPCDSPDDIMQPEVTMSTDCYAGDD